MKKLIKGMLFLIIVGTVMIGCEKDSMENIDNTTQTDIKNKSITEKVATPGDVAGGGPDDCGNRATNVEALERSIDTIDLTPAYAVESQILENSSKGLDYQDNYYVLSEYAIDNGYIVSEFGLHYNAAEAGVEAGEVIINGNNSDEVFTDSRYDDLMTLINFYEGQTNPTNIDDILSELKADLIANKNKSKSEVLDFVND